MKSISHIFKEIIYIISHLLKFNSEYLINTNLCIRNYLKSNFIIYPFMLPCMYITCLYNTICYNRRQIFVCSVTTKITIWHTHVDDNQWMGIIMIWPMSIRSRVDFDLSGDISKPTSCPLTCMNVR